MALMQAEGQNDALAALGLGLGTMKVVDLVEELLRTIRIDPPDLVKSLFSVGCVAAGVSFAASGGLRRRVLIGAAASGIAALAHSVERMARNRGDESATTVIARATLRR